MSLPFLGLYLMVIDGSWLPWLQASHFQTSPQGRKTDERQNSLFTILSIVSLERKK